MKRVSQLYRLSVVLAFWLLASTVVGIEFYVSPSGKDDNPGSRAFPFQSIERAKAEVRQFVQQGLSESVIVFLGGGRYELTKNLIFGPSDSGSEKHAITYRALRGEKVIINGGRRIENWELTDDGLWCAPVPEVKAGRWYFRQLIVNNRRAVRARWPNENGPLRIKSVTDGVKHFSFNQPLHQANLEGQETELVVLQHWSVTRGLIEKANKYTLTTRTPMGWIGHGSYTTASPGKTAYLENARIFIDRPGEWYLDRSEGILTYKPRPGETIAKTIVEAPVLQRLLVIAGRRGQPVRNLHFEGIRFEQTDFTFPAIGFNEIQAAHFGTSFKEPTYVHPVAIECVYAENCRFERCHFTHLNCSGLGFGAGSRDNIVKSCLFESIGGNGIMVGWRGVGRLKAGIHVALDADWKSPGDTPTGNEISHCLIRRCGMDAFGAVGIFAAFSADTRIAHNLIYDLPYTGISVGYRWDTAPTSQVRCIVEYNHIYDVMKKLADGGGIYTLGNQVGTTFRGNHIHDIRRSPIARGGAPNNGFFIDEGSKGFLFENNVVYDAAGGELRFNKSRPDWHRWKDNFMGREQSNTAQAKKIINKAGLGHSSSSWMDALQMTKSKPDIPKRRRLFGRRGQH